MGIVMIIDHNSDLWLILNGFQLKYKYYFIFNNLLCFSFFYSFIGLKTIVKLIRLIRLVVVFIYLIESCSFLNQKVM